MAKKTGRPEIKVDEVLLEKLALRHMTNQSIADMLNISVDTLDRRFADKIRIFKSKGKAKLLEKAFDMALVKNDWNALKFLLQNFAGMSDKVETKSENKMVHEIVYSAEWTAPQIKDVTPQIEDKDESDT